MKGVDVPQDRAPSFASSDWLVDTAGGIEPRLVGRVVGLSSDAALQLKALSSPRTGCGMYPRGVSDEVAPSKRPPLRRDAERNRDRILVAARSLIGDRGLDISHDEIAKAAHVGVGTVYRRFQTLEALLDELFYEELDVLVATAEAASELEDPWAAIRQFMERSFEQQAENRGLSELLIGHRGGTELARRAQSRIEPVVTRLVARAHAAGRLREDIGPTDFPMIVGMINAVMAAARDEAPDLWRRYLAIILDGIATGRRRSLPGVPPRPDQVERLIGRQRHRGSRQQ